MSILRLVLKHLEKIMADTSKLTTAVNDLAAKVDAMNAKPAPVPPVDDQSAIDAITTQVEAITAKIPA